MREQQDRLACSRAAQARDEIALALRRPQHMNIAGRKVRCAQAVGHRLRGAQGVPAGSNGVDLDQLLIDVAGELLRRAQHLRMHRNGRDQGSEQQ